MSTSTELDTIIPYERQSDPRTNRDCGAACLSMVYRSFCKDVARAQIWQAVRKQNRFGSFASTTYLMAQDALKRGFAAMAIQTRHPLQALKLCRDSGIRAILNHRLKDDVLTGHYSVLVDIDAKDVVLHDPLYGPSRRLPHAELLALWQRRFSSSEILGNVIIGIAAPPPAESACPLCHTPIPSSVKCPRCHEPVCLRPAALLGCMSSACAERVWNYLCCPSCDYTWNFSLQRQQARVEPPASADGRTGPPASAECRIPASVPGSPSPEAKAASQERTLNLDQLFNALDKFCNHFSPAAASHPELKQQLDFIAASKEKLTLALAEERAQAQARREQFANALQGMRQKEEARRKQLEELTRPLPPLDGNALGRALLRNLGLAD
jgi:hypothetical protein